MMIKSFAIISIAILYTWNSEFCSAQPDNNNNDNRCDAYGRCGPFGICNSQTSPICACVQGFDPFDTRQWAAGNWTSGCTRRVPLALCPGNGTGSRKDGFLDLDRMTLSGYSDRWVGPATGCEARCLSNCTCAAYTYDKVGKGCMFWSGDLMDIQVIPRGSGSQLHIRVAGFELGSEKGSKYKMVLIVIVVVGLVIVSVFGFLCWKSEIKRGGQRNASKDEKEVVTDTVALSIQDTLSGLNFVENPFFKMKVLALATNDFCEDNKLGMGGFGPVYKGELPNGREIAIKRLSTASGQGLQEFMNEMELISQLQHRNLIKILGCCVENNEKILLYEYMPNKSLDVYLFDPSEKILDWKKRLNIIIGICRGLLYLHRDSRLKIIHRDLKPSNILLDKNWNPKISDFGMARIYGTTQDYVSTVRVVGTYGYMAPEYAIEGRFSEKSDVYSFGVLMLEISTGRRNTSFIHAEGFSNLLGNAWKLWNEAKIVKLLDPRISSPSNQADILRCMHIGLLCAQELPKDRPLISSVLSMLTSDTMELPEPKQPAFPVNSSRSNAGTSSSQQSRKSSSSVNNFTVTMVEGR